MKIAIDTTPLSSAHSGRGIGGYTRNLVDALQQYETKHSYTLFTRGQNVPKDADIVHYPYFDPYFLTLPLSHPKPVVVTVHDLIPLVFPDKFPSGFRGMIKWQIQKYSLAKAQRIIADSVCSKRDINRITGFSEKHIDVVYLAASAVFHSGLSNSQITAIKKKYSLPARFILYVGDVNWNKNIIGLIQAFGLLTKERNFSDVNLLCVGKSFLNNVLNETQFIHRLVGSLGLKQSVLFPGYVPDEDLTGMYHLAGCLVQPSFYEGFGLPVLEAFASGCPVVCSDNSSLSEVMGPAIGVDPHDLASVASGIKQCLILTPQERNTFIRKGISWAERFSWKKAAKETVQVYERMQL